VFATKKVFWLLLLLFESLSTAMEGMHKRKEGYQILTGGAEDDCLASPVAFKATSEPSAGWADVNQQKKEGTSGKASVKIKGPVNSKRIFFNLSSTFSFLFPSSKSLPFGPIETPGGVAEPSKGFLVLR
jgi:hypothetical protein